VHVPGIGGMHICGGCGDAGYGLQSSVNKVNNYKNMMPKLNVLVIDDNEDMCKVISSILQVKGCETKAVRTCEEAIQVIKTMRPDMVSCDIRLNEKLSGLDFARIVRGDKETAHLFLIAVSAYCEEKEEALQAGFDMFLPKPVRFSDLTNAIELYCANANLLDRSRHSQLGS
jgi:CheY-like chemotaxis protein